MLLLAGKKTALLSWDTWPLWIMVAVAFQNTALGGGVVLQNKDKLWIGWIGDFLTQLGGDAEEGWFWSEPLMTFRRPERPVLLIGSWIGHGWEGFAWCLSTSATGDHRHHVDHDMVIGSGDDGDDGDADGGDDVDGDEDRWWHWWPQRAVGGGQGVGGSGQWPLHRPAVGHASLPPGAQQSTWVHLGRHLAPPGYWPRFLWLTWLHLQQAEGHSATSSHHLPEAPQLHLIVHLGQQDAHLALLTANILTIRSPRSRASLKHPTWSPAPATLHLGPSSRQSPPPCLVPSCTLTLSFPRS